MKSKHTLAILVVSTLWSLGTSCKKEPEVIQVDPGFEQAYSFKVGSYWTYKDSLTGDIDSFAVISNRTVVGTEYSNSQTYEYIQLEIRSFRLGTHTNDSMSIDLSLHDNLLHQSYRTQDRGLPYSFETHIYPYSAVSSNSSVQKFQSYVVNGISYTNVVGCLVGWIGINDDSFYYCESIGIIKIRISTNGVLKRVWELQDSHIVH